MSVDVAVWEGPTPSDDGAAAETFDELYERYVESEEVVPPSPRIREYVQALLAEYPDLTVLSDEDVDSSPWAAGPLMNDASGPIVYLSVSSSVSDEAWAHIVGTARTMGLVCFAPGNAALVT